MRVFDYVSTSLCFLAVYAHTQCPKGNNELPGGEVGLPVPPEECLVPVDDFLLNAANQTYVSVYKIDTNRAVSATATRIQLDSLPDGRIRTRTAAWTESGCRSTEAFHPKICGGVTILTPPAGGARLPFRMRLPTWNSRILSCSPAEYFIYFLCADTSRIVCGKCPNVIANLYVRDRREDTDGDGIPDGDPDFTGVPWDRIKKFSKHCLGEEFDNNDNVGWEWSGSAQPNECPLQ